MNKTINTPQDPNSPVEGPPSGKAGTRESAGPIHKNPETVDRRPVNDCGVVFCENGKPVPVVDGWAETEFDFEPGDVLGYMTTKERVTFELREAAVRIVAGIEHRTFEEIANELGVTRAALSRVYRDVLGRIGSLRVYDNAEKRLKLSEATRRHWQKRKEMAA